jgi:thiol-activated cytolysin
LAALVLSGCSAGEGFDGAPEADEPLASVEQKVGNDERETGINEIIYDTLDISALPEEQEQIGDWSSFEYRNTGTFKCNYREVNEVDNTSEIALYSPNAGLLYAGSLVQGDSIAGGILEPISLPRSGGTVTVEGIDILGTPRFRDIPTYSSGHVQSAVSQIFEEATSVSNPANGTYTVEDVRKLESTLLDLGVSAEWAKAKLNLTLSSSESHKRTDLFVLHRQAYYTVAVQSWFGPNKALAFPPSVQPDEVALVMSPRNPPAYIRSVTYGRMLIMRVTTDV